MVETVPEVGDLRLDDRSTALIPHVDGDGEVSLGVKCSGHADGIEHRKTIRLEQNAGSHRTLRKRPFE